MLTHIIEVTQKGTEVNWGKFLLGQMDSEWLRPSHLPLREDLRSSIPLLAQRGWSRRDHFIVFDLETGEGAQMSKGPGPLRTQLDLKHKIWVCPMMGPFLDWLSDQTWEVVTSLPTFVALETDE